MLSTISLLPLDSKGVRGRGWALGQSQVPAPRFSAAQTRDLHFPQPWQAGDSFLKRLCWDSEVAQWTGVSLPTIYMRFLQNAFYRKSTLDFDILWFSSASFGWGWWACILRKGTSRSDGFAPTQLMMQPPGETPQVSCNNPISLHKTHCLHSTWCSEEEVSGFRWSSPGQSAAFASGQSLTGWPQRRSASHSRVSLGRQGKENSY